MPEEDKPKPFGPPRFGSGGGGLDDVHDGATIRDEPGATVKDPGERTPPSTTPPTRGGASSRPPSDPTPEEVRRIQDDPSTHLGHYVMCVEVGRGGMGSVWKAWDAKLARWVAIKILNTVDESSVRRFQREAQLAGRLRHANIAAVHEVGEARGWHYLVMEFIDGGAISKAGLPMRRLLETFVKVCRAVAYAHQNSIIHRDIKPANVMMSRGGEPFVTDFGLAKALESESSISISGSVMGTPAYMSPEQATGRIEEVDARSDIYSLGATLYMLVTGKPPFEAENTTALLYKVTSSDPASPRRLNAELPPAVESIILKAMAKEKNLRYGTAGEMAEDLERFLNDQPVAARPPGLANRIARRVRRNPWAFAATAVLLVAIGVVAALLMRGKPAGGVEATPEQKWKARFQPLQEQLAYVNFREASPELIADARRAMADMPGSLQGQVSAWLADQVERLPRETWPKASWLDRQPDARRLLAWCGAIEAVLEGLGEPFAGVRGRTGEARARFAAVAQYRGKITLRIYLWPHAQVRELRAGGAWIVRDGKTVGDVHVADEDLDTPVVLEGLDLADYELTVWNPELGRKDLAIPSGSLKNGGTYFYSGYLDAPDSIRLIASP